MRKTRCVDDEDLPLLFDKEGYLIQILIRLPVVSLLRFKSVCISWRSLIESSYFIDLHTATSSSSSSKFGSFILHATVERREPAGLKRLFENAVLMLSVSDASEWLSRSGSGSGSGGWWWNTGSNGQLSPSWPPLKYKRDNDDSDSDYDDQVLKVDDDDQLVLKLDNLGFPSCYELGDYFSKNIVGSCNGLVCLYHQEHNQFSFWNPATRQFRNLPKTINVSWLPCSVPLIGFYFDAETNDYKVVLLTSFKQERYYGNLGPYIPLECLCRVQVYSLSTDSWKLLEGITCLPGYPFSGINQGKLLYRNGCFFFMAHFLHSTHQKCFPDNDKFMISFDLIKEIITPLQLPDHHRDDKLYLSYLGDKIALFTAPQVYDNDTKIYTYEDFKADYYAEIDTDYNNYEDGDTGICNDDTDYTNSEDDDDTGICNHEDSFNSGTSISSDEMEFCHICGYEDFNIWVLNEHSTMNKEYWKKLHSFRTELKRLGDWSLPRGISNDGKFALLETKDFNRLGKKMKLYNLLDNEVKNNFLSCSEVMSNATAYKPSLVSIIGGNGAGAAAAAPEADMVIGNGTGAAATDLKQGIKSTVTMDGELPCIWMQHFPMMVAAQSMYNDIHGGLVFDISSEE